MIEAQGRRETEMLEQYYLLCVATFSVDPDVGPAWRRAIYSAQEVWRGHGWNLTEVPSGGRFAFSTSGAPIPVENWVGYFDYQASTIYLNGDRKLPPDHRTLTVTHEVGHVFGFKHAAEFDSIMYPYLGLPGQGREMPEATDYCGPA
jgi:Matrixin